MSTPTPDGPFAALLGQPVAQSLSPVLHNAAFRHAGLPARYLLWEVAPDDLAGAVARLRAPACVGANVTVPHKEAVVPYLDDLAPLAARIGAVNTIVKQGAALRGENTDAGGFIAPLRQRAIPFDVTDAVILGAGGAARGIAVALLDAGVRRLTIANRTPARAVALAAALDDRRVDVAPLAGDDLAGRLGGTTLLVEATSRGWQDDAPAPATTLLALLPATALVYDLTYGESPLLRAATARGLATLDGLPMLVEQGALAWEHWTGQPAPRAVMWAAAVAERERRRAAREQPSS